MSSLVDATYRQLREMILEGALRAGTPIQENALARQLNVSRTPVREAIGRLTSEGLIARNAGRPSTVQHVTLNDFIEILHLRRLLETEAAGLAAKRPDAGLLEPLIAATEAMMAAKAVPTADYIALDDRLHRTIAEMSGSQLLAQSIADLRLKTRIFDLGGITRRLKPSGSEHLDLLTAILAGDIDRSRQTMTLHIDQVRSSILADLGGLFDT